MSVSWNTETFAEPSIVASRRDDGSYLIASTEHVAEHPATVLESFRSGSENHPDRVLVAEKRDGAWAACSWGDARRRVDRLAQGLIEQDLAKRPVMILSQNSIGHLLITLAAYTAGVPVVPASVAYSLQSTDHAKLTSMVAAVEPGVIYAEDATFAEAIRAVGTGRVVLSADTLEQFEREPDRRVDESTAQRSGDSIAKIMFTSGSTGAPKGVINTHGMLAVNQQQIRQVWPFLSSEPPVLLDWLPWSHTFGGNHNVNMVLVGGGSLWIDDGRPTPALIGRTIDNLREVQPTVYFNVPAGYAALVPRLEQDDVAAELFFRRLRLGFFAAASLPQLLWERLESLAERHHSAMVMTTSWGMTETAPSATTTHFANKRSNCIGVPLPGVELKLVPAGAKYELLLRGPNITPGFHERADLTAEAFDSEGYLKTGDATCFVDPTDPDLGLVFDGRIAEDFKLSTGTFVSVGTLRPKLLSACGGLVTDAVICGHDGDFVSALLWLHPDQAHRVDSDGVAEESLRQELADAMDRLAAEGGGSSQRVRRMLVLTEPPALDAGEITDKGYVNQRVTRERRADRVAELMAPDPSPRVITRHEVTA